MEQLVKKIQEIFKAWKAKHWDDKFFFKDSEFYSWMGVDRPPLRRLWEQHASKCKRLAAWAAITIAGALLLAVLGLS